jgi:putative lipoic acid-binding regulatory protein
MSQHPLPSLEVLKATHRFPTQYTFKAIGQNEADFVGRVLESVRAELGHDAPPPHQVREAAGGRHIAITLELRLATAEQILGIYRSILTVDGLVLLL